MGALSRGILSYVEYVEEVNYVPNASADDQRAETAQVSRLLAYAPEIVFTYDRVRILEVGSADMEDNFLMASAFRKNKIRFGTGIILKGLPNKHNVTQQNPTIQR